MLRDIGSFGCLPIGIALVLANFLTSTYPLIAIVCGGLFLYAGMPILIGFFLARVKRNRDKNIIRNGLVAAILGAIVSPTVLAIVLVIPSMSTDALRIWYAWTLLGFTLAGITATVTTSWQHGNKMLNRYQNRSVSNEIEVPTES